MKVLILTFSKEDNRGANLQSFALSYVLQKLGAKVEFLDIQLIHRYGIKSIVPLLNNYFAARFRKKHKFKFTRKYASLDDLKRDVPKADVYIVGSDQVWNTEITKKIDPRIYFFTFLPSQCRKYAYAASFGTNFWHETPYDAEIKCALKKFDGVGVREKSGIKICKEYFGLDRAVHVLDPTLLLEEATVRKLFRPSQKRDGIFNYFLYIDEQTKELTNKICDILSLPLLGVPLNPSYKEKVKAIYGIEKWLQKIQSAEFVITNSFHCVVFCILLRRPFVAVPSSPGKSERILSLLEDLGLSNRFINTKDKVSRNVLSESIDYDDVFDKLNLLKERSLSFIMNLLNKD